MWVPVFSPEDGGSVFLENIGTYLQVHITSQSRRQQLEFQNVVFLFQAELELLLMNEGSEKNHFSLKSIQEQEVEGKKRHKKKGKKKLIKEENKRDDFEVILVEATLKSNIPLHFHLYGMRSVKKTCSIPSFRKVSHLKT
jgi:hypothetical protein